MNTFKITHHKVTITFDVALPISNPRVKLERIFARKDGTTLEQWIAFIGKPFAHEAIVNAFNAKVLWRQKKYGNANTIKWLENGMRMRQGKKELIKLLQQAIANKDDARLQDIVKALW